MPVPLVLASASPARLATLRGAGLAPYVQVSQVDEPAVVARVEAGRGPLSPADHALVLAEAKRDDVAGRLHAQGCTDRLVLGCDSVLELDGRVHGKPELPQVATDRWRTMRGRSGTLHSGHAVTDLRTGRSISRTASTVVHFAELTDDEIERYVATGEPLWVAGAFTVDGLGGAFVTGIEGDHHNVVGVSLPLLRELLLELGVGWFDLERVTPDGDV
ncbi:nucleoside triphosphate pyrophosphatase [Arsenicicoccus dermatophilus]|uniref:Maf family protein n=1 Tax=Arsenicicoccus dermatophilus TaxID=1076331 RepID=UPI0038918813